MRRSYIPPLQCHLYCSRSRRSASIHDAKYSERNPLSYHVLVEEWLAARSQIWLGLPAEVGPERWQTVQEVVVIEKVTDVNRSNYIHRVDRSFHPLVIFTNDATILPAHILIDHPSCHLAPSLMTLVYLSSEHTFVSGLRKRHDAAKRRH
jgi:hypothetical protein